MVPVSRFAVTVLQLCGATCDIRFKITLQIDTHWPRDVFSANHSICIRRNVANRSKSEIKHI